MGFITVLIIGLFCEAWTQETGSPVCSSKLHCCDGGGRPTETQGLIPGCSNLTSLLGGEVNADINNPIPFHQATCKSSTHQVCCGGSVSRGFLQNVLALLDGVGGVGLGLRTNLKNIPNNIRKLLVAILERGNCDSPATSDDLATLAEHGYPASCCREVDGHPICCGNATGCISTCKSDSDGIIPCTYPKCAIIRCMADCDLAEGLLN